MASQWTSPHRSRSTTRGSNTWTRSSIDLSSAASTRKRSRPGSPARSWSATDCCKSTSSQVRPRRNRRSSIEAPAVRRALMYGIDPKKIVLSSPPEAKGKRDDQEGKDIGFGGIARRIERYYRRYRQRGEASSRMEAWLDKVMVEHTCPDCNGARVRASRLLFTIDGKTVHDASRLNFDELHAFLGTVEPTGRGADAGRQVIKEIRGRLELLLGIGL